MGRELTTVALSRGEQRALASFLAGRLPAGQLHGELVRQREAAIATAAAREASGSAEVAVPRAAVPALAA